MTGERVLVTGATGYIGGRLVPRLLESGRSVRCLVRDPRKVADRPWADDPRVEIVTADAEASVEQLTRALEGCGPAYYLIHSMIAAREEYRERDRRLARNFAEAAAQAGLHRIIYLGGLGETGAGLSAHLASRREVEECLTSGSVPVTTFRAAMIIGSGSASFEILRYLVERLPVMATSRWVRTPAQPIGIRNVLQYLVRCLDVPQTIGRTLDIGGADVHTYQEIVQMMAEVRGLRRRWIIPLPVLTPRLSSLLIHLVTPLSRYLARPLAEGLRNPVVCRNDEARKLVPIDLMTTREALEAAFERSRGNAVETAWHDAGPIPGDPEWAGGTTFEDRRETIVDADVERVFRAACRVGGRQGWYSASWLWEIRGAIDRALGGPGLHRGRRHPEEISTGDALDFWRVGEIRRGRALELRAEMKLPGEAALVFETEPTGTRGQTRLIQTARFWPRGVMGLLYWMTVVPVHGFVFRSMLQGIRADAERRDNVLPASDLF